MIPNNKRNRRIKKGKHPSKERDLLNKMPKELSDMIKKLVNKTQAR